MSKTTEAKTYRQKLLDGEVHYREGSRKSECFKAFCSGGEEAAIKKAKALKIKDATIRSWLGDWRLIQQHNAPSPVENVAPKKPTKKATKKVTTKTSAKKSAAA